MTTVKKRRSRNPDATVKAIFEACISRLAVAGPEGVTLLDVAKLAGVNRSTAYAYFKTRENLVRKTIKWVSERLFHTVFGDPESADRRPPESDMLGLVERLVNFAMENPELCRVWLMQVLTLPNPAADPFWREFRNETARVTKTKLAQPDIDADVFTLKQLAAAFLWPMTVRARTKDSKEQQEQAHRYVRETVRQALYGTMRPEHFPDLIKRLQLLDPKKAGRETAKNDREGGKLTLTVKNGRTGEKSARSRKDSSRSLTMTLSDQDAERLWQLLENN